MITAFGVSAVVSEVELAIDVAGAGALFAATVLFVLHPKVINEPVSAIAAKTREPWRSPA